MENYTITKLSELFQTTRGTVYNKFKDASIERFLDVDEKGTKTLRPEGFTAFQMLIANSKAANKHDDKHDANVQQETPSFYGDYIKSLQDHIRILNDQIEFMKHQLERSEFEKADMARRFDGVNDAYMTLTKPKKLLSSFFGKNK